MPFVQEIVEYLKDEGVGTPGASILVSTKSVVPTGTGPYLTIFETGGMTPFKIHELASPAYQRPSAQLVGIGATYPIAETIIRKAYWALTKVRNQVLGDTQFTVSSIVRVGSTVTVTTTQAHRYIVDMSVTIAGATPTDYNGSHVILTVPSPTTFTFSIAGAPATPATGSMSVSFAGTLYLSITAIQEPFDLGLDKSDRARLAFNINAVKRPS